MEVPYSQLTKKQANKRRANLPSVKRNAQRRKQAKGEGDDIRPWLKLLRQQKTFRCYWCGEVKDNQSPHVDHMEPLIKGGTHTWDNICVSCQSCNLTKHDTSLVEWRLGNAIINKEIQAELYQRSRNRSSRKFIRNGYK